MSKEHEYYSQEGMERELERLLEQFRNMPAESVMARIPLYLHECDYEKKKMVIRMNPTPWMADRTGDMSNGAFSVAMDETMGILCLYLMDGMTPTITMQMSMLHPIPINQPLYISTKLLGTDGTKIDVTATAWSGDRKDRPVCSAVGIYYGPGKEIPGVV